MNSKTRTIGKKVNVINVKKEFSFSCLLNFVIDNSDGYVISLGGDFFGGNFSSGIILFIVTAQQQPQPQ